MSTDPVAHRVVVITGGSAGIGAAIARRLAEDGYSLVLAARGTEALEAVAKELADGDADVIAVPTDVTRREQVERLRDAAIARFGRIDVWINNAGRGITRSVLDLTDADLDEMMTVNVKSALYGMQAAAAAFIAQGAGHVINISSLLGRVPLAAHRSAYNAAKAALNALTANLRADLARYPGIHVSLVMPGMVRTNFSQHALHASPNATFRPWSDEAPQSVEEIAEIVAALIAEPKAEVYTSPALANLARRYIEDAAAVEASVHNRRHA
jgi:short-subunit dehydrogenase